MSRSQSRGREYESTGRGGVGNIRPQSHSRDPIARQGPGPEDYSHTRGRELRNEDPAVPIHSGRGGAGNIRSPSRDTKQKQKQADYDAETKVVKEYDSHHIVHSSGRGGAGNIDRSRSRSRDPAYKTPQQPQQHTAGRGGYGNTYEGGPPNPTKFERVEEEERYKASLDDKAPHTSGRGGYGNTTDTGPLYDTQASHPHTTGGNPSPDPNPAYASGRGGAGNIHGGTYTNPV